jgi:hypothetical protein
MSGRKKINVEKKTRALATEWLLISCFPKKRLTPEALYKVAPLRIRKRAKDMYMMFLTKLPESIFSGNNRKISPSIKDEITPV